MMENRLRLYGLVRKRPIDAPIRRLETWGTEKTRKFLLDPAIHEEFMRLKNLAEEKEKRVKELQDSINAISFTPNSKMGKMLIARCKTLQEENEEIGNQASEGKIKEMSMKLALQKSRNTELMNQFEGVCKNIEALASDVERSNEMVVILQEKLEERDTEINRLNLELQQRNVVEETTDEAAIVNNEQEPSEDVEAAQGEQV
ncbi:hypothetical protein KSS87_022564 [Heliosperma pusillum]|nr:hypothetical protein KSS87_022564 [Heliosperma pusillum]